MSGAAGGQQRRSGAVQPDVVTLAAYGSYVVIAGTIPVAVRLGGLELPPFWAAGLRFGLAAIGFGAIAILQRAPFPRGRALVGTILYGTVFFGVGIPLFYLGLSVAPAAVASIALALLPLATLLLGAVVGLAPLSVRGLAGGAVAAGGIVLIVMEQLGAAVPLMGLVALGATTLAYALALVLLKRVPPGHPTAANAIAMAIGTPILLGLSALAHEDWSVPTEGSTVASFLYLVLVATIVFFQLGLFAIGRLTAAAFSFAVLLAPAVTAVLAAVTLAESIMPTTIAGGLIVAGGVWLGVFSRERRSVAVPTRAQP